MQYIIRLTTRGTGEEVTSTNGKTPSQDTMKEVKYLEILSEYDGRSASEHFWALYHL
nr:MAG TPA: hypothetical protein [Caudoviricetes sp.]DAZ39209.1 MAG TPA: hypothetical protein [Caudoviricetes sp.]